MEEWIVKRTKNQDHKIQIINKSKFSN